MSVRTAIYDILQADSNVTDEISTRLYMTFAPSTTALPFIVFRSDLIEDWFTKDNDSLTDKHDVEIDIYHNSIADAETLGGKVRTALQGYKGTINGVLVKGCRMTEENQEFDVEQNPVWSQDYEIIIDR